ncbi:Gfo/Idh/MocA family protein [Paenibacillus cymbidii]|uniref:Gfo/Idh/MocA family protein n=1 Tax=Paenibacillus cymbidii TaxID=1639034 RepID=UPI001080D322|nr:Gfo/Idh/MocA family oxidoreductase [Paenibacillus cymbidii]
MVKVAIVGAGGIAQTHLKVLAENEDVRMVAVCDVVKESAEKAALAYGMKSYTDFDSMLDREQIDALFVCVPPFGHEDIEEKAAAKNIHLLVEKPIGLDMASARRKAEAIKSSGIIAASGYCLRYIDVVEQARHYLADKPIGMVSAHYLSGFVNTPWWRDLAKSGGQLIEQATHTVDLVRYLAGEIRSVYGLMGYGLLEDKAGATIPSVVTVGLDFVSGAVGHIDTACIQPDWRNAVEVMGKDYRLTLSGKSLTITEPNRTTTLEGKTQNMYKEQDDAFIEAVRTHNPALPRSSYANALHTLEVSLAAYESARDERRVKLHF